MTAACRGSAGLLREFATLSALSLLLGAACVETLPVAPPPAGTGTGAPIAATSETAVTAAPDWSQKGVPRLVADARRLANFVKTDGARRFLSRAPSLPSVATRTLFHDTEKTRYYTEAEAAALAAEARGALTRVELTEEDYYSTRYGSPLSYCRPLDILFSKGVSLPPGAKMLDFGYGYVGHLRLLASLGVHVTGVDPWPLLRALYSWPGDQGEIPGPAGEKGTLRLVDGYFPTDPKVVAAVGSGYDLIISKNVLKKGYIHPDRPVPNPKRQIQLGVSDEVAIKAFFDALRPGGHFLVYNISPAPTPLDKPFVPYSDGRSPFTKAQWEAAGFEVLALDQDDVEAVRVMGRALGWDQPEDGEPGMDLVNDLSVLYTLLRRPAPRDVRQSLAR
jgi:SAM-dependent methyltransferase